MLFAFSAATLIRNDVFIDSDEDYKNVFETDFIKYVEHLKRKAT